MQNSVRRRHFLKAAVPIVAAGGVAGRKLLSLADEPPSTTASAPTASPIPQRVLGKTALKVSILGVGGLGILSSGAAPEPVLEYLQEAIGSTINFFDTAPVYGKDGLSERNLGLLMGTVRRKDLVLASKVENRTYDGAMRQVEASLQRLKTDYIDIMQVHSVNDADDVKAFGRSGGVLTALQKLRDQRVIRHIGVTGHPDRPRVKEALETFDWDTFMCFVNPAKSCQTVFDEQLPVARRKNMGIIAMKTLGAEPGRLVGQGPGRADAASLLRYAWDSPIHTAIPSMRTLKQLQENVDAARAYKPMSIQERQDLVEQISRGKPWRY